jgi:hypothetical protein
MGDRANIVIKSGEEQVCLYTHYDGYRLTTILQAAMIHGESRWEDFQYLTRIIFCEMIKGMEEGLTGYGITQNIHAGGENVIVVDVDAQSIGINGLPCVRFGDFIEGKRLVEGNRMTMIKLSDGCYVAADQIAEIKVNEGAMTITVRTKDGIGHYGNF